jgi:integrase
MTLGARYGHLHVRDSKSRFARRNVPLMARVRALLEARKAESNSPGVFGGEVTWPMLNNSLAHLHEKLKQLLKMWGEFVLHSLRHTYGTRLGEAGANAFTSVRLRGHSGATVSQALRTPDIGSIGEGSGAVRELPSEGGKYSARGPETSATHYSFRYTSGSCVR